MNVHITKHATDRWREYHEGTMKEKMEGGKIAYVVKRHLVAAMRAGTEYDNATGAVHIEIHPWLVAVCVPGMGRWNVVTFYLREEAG
jgi:hypothetical protein